ncbi:MAG TPA: poly-gamma-glutamate synthase PgsB, partial [Paenibacillaceae bacterium]|nr:poly-gamma-glutamate synthase PgsB [Paenibacillaceae bacterium]
MWLILVSLFLLLVLGILQKIKHQKNIDSIPIIINVNGIRGKSTVTRLITGILKEADLWVIGKTTGASERILYWDSEEEEEMNPRRGGSLLTDQLKLAREAAQLEADALVCECKALDPDEQKLFQNQLLQGNIGVITNVYEDHLDVMGPTLDQVAEALASTIPYEGFLVVTEGPYVDYFKEIAYTRDTEVLVVDPDDISDDILN